MGISWIGDTHLLEVLWHLIRELSVLAPQEARYPNISPLILTGFIWTNSNFLGQMGKIWRRPGCIMEAPEEISNQGTHPLLTREVFLLGSLKFPRLEMEAPPSARSTHLFQGLGTLQNCLLRRQWPTSTRLSSRKDGQIISLLKRAIYLSMQRFWGRYVGSQ